MEGSAPVPKAAGDRKELSIDPVKAQGIVAEVSRKSNYAARVWQQKWGFYTRIPEIKEEEALKIGMTLEEYRTAKKLLSNKVEPKKCPVDVEPSPKPFPTTSAGMVGRRVLCPLERYGRLVKTARDYPTRPPLPPGQIYDPYKQTMVFLGSVEGDPISYKLTAWQTEVTDEMWARPQQLQVSAFNSHFVKQQHNR